MSKQVEYITVLCSCVNDCQEFIVNGALSGKIVIKNTNTKETRYAKAGGAIFSMGIVGDNIYVGTEFGEIETYSLRSGKFISCLSFSQDPVTHISCSDNFFFTLFGDTYTSFWFSKLVKSSPLDLNITCSRIDSAAISPDSSFFAVKKCCGTATIWMISGQTFVKVQDKKCHFNKNRCKLNSREKVTISWSCHNELAVPGKQGVQIFKPVKELGLHVKPRNQSDQFILKTFVTYEQDTDEIYTTSSFSKSGEYLSCGSLSGSLLVWSNKRRQVVFHKIRFFKNIKNILFTHVERDLDVLDGGSIFKIEEFLKEQKKLNSFYDKSISRYQSDLINPALLGKLPLNMSSNSTQTNLKSRHDLERRPNSHPSHAYGSKATPATMKRTKLQPFDDTKKHLSLLPQLVEPDIKMKSFKDRYAKIVVWNEFGFIELYEALIVLNLNQNLMFPITINYPNYEKFTTATLSTDFALFAHSGNDSRKSMVKRYQFSTMRTDWSITFPTHEYVLGVAIGTNWIVACTNKNKIRVFDHEGKQRHVIEIPQKVEYAVGHNDLLFCTSKTQWTSHFSDHYYSVYKISKKLLIAEITCHSRLPISEGAEVKWSGFTDEGSPTFADSQNSIRVLKTFWTEIFSSTSKIFRSTSIKFQGVNETSQTIRYYDCATSLSQHSNLDLLLHTTDFQVPKCNLEYFQQPTGNEDTSVKMDTIANNKNPANDVACKPGNDPPLKICSDSINEHKIKERLSALEGRFGKNINSKMQASHIRKPISYDKCTKKLSQAKTKPRIYAGLHLKAQSTNCSNLSADSNKPTMTRKELRRQRFLRALLQVTTRSRFHPVQISNKLKRIARCRIRKAE